jgi:hypothetical protein
MRESRSTSEPRRDLLERLFITGGLVLVLVPIAAIVGWIATHRGDLPLLDDGDLAASRSVVTDGANGFETMKEAADRTHLSQEDEANLTAIAPGAYSDPAWVRSAVARNAEALAALERALAAPMFQFPVPPAKPARSNLNVPTLMRIESLVKLAAAEAQVRVADGDSSGVLDRSVLGVRVGKTIGTSEGVMLPELSRASSCLAIGLGSLESIVRRVVIDAPTARELVSRLESARWREDTWQRVWADEYQHLKASLLELDKTLAAGPPDARGWSVVVWKLKPLDYLWQPNRTLTSLAEIYRDRVHRAALPCRELSAEPELEWSPWTFFSPNGIGRQALLLSGPNSDSIDKGRCHSETRFALLEMLIAARAYWQSNHERPRQLADLVPDYLRALPEDRFAGAPLRYDAARGVAYSVGDDFVDGGGGEHPDASSASEPAISLVF